MPRYDLTRLTLREMTECGAALRRIGEGAASLEEVADRVVRFCYESLGGAGGERACVLARFYLTRAYGELEPSLQAFVRSVMGGEPVPASVTCLTLLGTAGDEPAWNDRRASVRHRAIPLPSELAVRRLPMVAQLIGQLEVPVHALLEPSPEILLDLQQRTFNVFSVPEAVGSPFIPAQDDFVVPFGVASSVGFGGVLPTGDLFATVLFTRSAVPRETAELFRPLALSVKLAVLPFAWGPVFSGAGPDGAGRPRERPAGVGGDERLRARVAALEQLLEEQDRTTMEQTARLERAREQAEDARSLAESQAVELETQTEELQAQAARLEEAQRELQAANGALAHTNEALARGVERTRFMLDAMPQKVWTADSAGKVGFFNRRWLEYAGLEPEALRDWGWQRIVHPEDWPENLRVWRRSIDTGEDFELEHRLLRADGAYRWHLSRGVAQRGEDGRVVTWVGTNTDVDDQKRAAEEVRSSVERYRLVTRATNDVIWDWDLTTDDVVWNEGLQSILGYPDPGGPSHVEFWYDHVHPEDRTRVVEGIHAVIEGGQETWSDQYRFRRGDGSYAVVLDRGIVSRDLAGRPVRMIGSMQDVSDRIRAEAERERLLALARLERERLQRIFAAAPAVMALYSGPDHVITTVNPTWERTVGKPDAVGRPFRDVFPEFEGSGLFELLDRVYETQEPYVNPEVTVPLERWGSGEPEITTWHLVWLPLPGREGEAERDILVHAVEVTEQVRARHAVDAARRAAEDANRAKSGFLATMSHELRTPLNAMIGYTDLLQMGVPEPIADGPREQVRRIGLSARHLLQLIEEILSFSRLEAGREEVQPEPVDLGELMAEVSAILEPLAQEKGLRFAVRRPADLAEVETDPRKLRQILINLAGNAVKFTAAGEIALRVRESDGWICFEVRDTGIGIAAEHLSLIFEPFRQVQTERSERAHGTGLGLSVSRGLARLLGGELSVESVLGAGSTFVLRLPLRPPGSRPDPAPENGNPAAA